MKATFFRANWSDEDKPRIGSVEFRVTFDEPKGYQEFFVFELDEDLNSNYKLESWQYALLDESKVYIKRLAMEGNILRTDEEFELIARTRPTYLLQNMPDGQVLCTLEVDNDEANLDDCFTSAWNSFTEAASEAFDSIAKSAVSFFSTPKFVPYRFGDSESLRFSCFNPDQIDKIETLINQLEKEINSVWYPNKELKMLKRDKLKDMLTDSNQEEDIYKLVDKYMRTYPEMLEGYFSRTRELLDDLKTPMVNTSKVI